MLGISSFAQDIPPAKPPRVQLQTPNNLTFWYNPEDSTVWIWKGSYGWTKLAGAKQFQHKIDSLTFLNFVQVKDTIGLKGYFTNFKALSKTDSVTGTSPIVVTKTSQKVYDVSINPADCDNNGYMLAVDKCFLDSLKLKRGILKGDSALIKTTTGDSITTTTNEYGALYNQFVTTDVRKISSDDNWIVPSKTIFDDLITYLGGGSVAGGKLKETGTVHWLSPNVGATNETGFTAQPGGYRNLDQNCSVIGDMGLLWSSTDFYFLKIYSYLLSSDVEGDDYQVTGYSIRLCNPTTIHSDGYTGTYTGNNFKAYPTIVINGVEWLSENLNENKYRTGEYIHGFEGGVYRPISNSTWAGLTSEAMCYYTTTKVPVITNIYLGDTIKIPNITNLATKDTLANYWNKQEITEPDTTRWSLGYAAYLWGNHASAGYLTGLTVDSPLSGLGTAASHLTVDLSSKENAFSKNTGFNLNLGTTSGTVLEGRTFGTAANSSTTDFSPSSVYPATGLTTGYVPYKSATVLANSGFYWDAVNQIGGIGTTAPVYKLDINTPVVPYVDTYSGLQLQADGYGYILEGGLKQLLGGALKFSVNNAGTISEKVRFDNNGNVGIGYSTGTEIANNKLAVNGNTFINGTVSINRNTTGLYLNRDALTNYCGMEFRTANNNRWLTGMRENFFLDNYVIYNENIGIDVLTLDIATNNAIFAATVDATGYKLSGVSTFLDWSRTGYAGNANQVLIQPTNNTTSPAWSNWFKADWNQTDSTKNNWIRNKPTLSGSNTGDQTLTIAGTTSPTIALSGSNTATFAAGTGITLGQSAGTITITGTGSGVTTIGVTTANGVSGTSSGGTTPSLTIALGAITPTTVNGLQVSLGKNSIGNNVALSSNALRDNTSGYYNVAIGSSSLQDNTSGLNNVAIGVNALISNTTSSGSVGIGCWAGYASTDANSFYLNNIYQGGSMASDKAYSLLYGQFSGTAGSLTGQQLTVNGALNVNGTITGTNLPIAGSFSGVGTATTVFTVTIGRTMANTTYKVNVTPTSVLSAALFYVTNKTTTTFDVTYMAGLTGTVTFDWILSP